MDESILMEEFPRILGPKLPKKIAVLFALTLAAAYRAGERPHIGLDDPVSVSIQLSMSQNVGKLLLGLRSPEYASALRNDLAHFRS